MLQAGEAGREFILRKELEFAITFTLLGIDGNFSLLIHTFWGRCPNGVHQLRLSLLAPSCHSPAWRENSFIWDVFHGRLGQFSEKRSNYVIGALHLDIFPFFFRNHTDFS
ncbi:hypothetical protein CEXT_803251 [Caerostris extrusa]|uniref:Uncharacterized protein n=1 Tax=Caerostris extrusa TaxID=172846 RepID=A0AAV4R2G0_CAEEX|nr:hypothetical protein CEXT_803251 [Caerostris extrusa]